MDIRKHILLFVSFLLLCTHHLTTKLVCASSVTKETNITYSDVHRTKWIQEQIDGTIDICSDILGTKWKNEINQTQNRCQTLTVWVPKKTAFTEFVNVNKDGELEGGFSIAIFCLVLRELPFKIQPVFVPFINEKGERKGSYDELVQHIEGKDCEAVAGDITISAKRTRYVDFTLPYMSSEIYMLVPATQKWSQTLMTLLKPFTTGLWFTIISVCIFIGVAISILEYRAGNPEFKVPSYQKVIMIIWFPISTFFFHEGRILNRCSKIVLVIWLTTIFIVIQIFTACLSSWLTVNQLQPKIPKQYHVVGYQNGSLVRDFANDHVQGPSKIGELKPLSSTDDYKKALDNGTVDAIFIELPYIDIFIAKHGNDYMKVGPLSEETGLGFGFSRGSSLQLEFSRAVVKVTESPDMTLMKKRYLGTLTRTPTQSANVLPQRLDVHSFFLLFLFTVLTTITTIVWSEISLMHKPAQIFPVILIPDHKMSPDQTISPNSTPFAENED